MNFAVVVFVVLPMVCVAQRTPSISYITQEQIKDIGGTVELQCSVQYAKEYAVVWTKTGRDRSDSVFLSTGSSLVIKDSRFAIRHDISSSTYTLQIKDIQETDAGIYQCQVILSVVNKITADVELQVRRPPVISDNSTQSIVASEGKAVQMECYAAGYPRPTITWRRENNAILPTGGSTYTGNVLKINSVRKEDRGTYYCVADNQVSKGDRRNINLEVEFAPVITVPRPRLGQALQYDMDLECHIEAYPPPAIVCMTVKTFLFTLLYLPLNPHLNVSIAGGSTYTGNVLKINSVRKEDRGTYYCVADNQVSKGDRRNINLEVEFAPVITVPRPRLGQALQYDMDLECHIEAYPPTGHYSTLRVITIEKRQYGDFVCKAINKLGQAEAKVHLFETVIPVCPPACGQAHYGEASSVPISSVIIFLGAIAVLFS
uniref:Putative lachesin n=1 Tax=Lutzomyia longipalpis TaxID=7200 RepID=A0A1B0CCB4_LUTLO